MLMAGLAIANTVFGFLGASRAARAQEKIDKANAAAENRIRIATNEFKAAESSLQNFNRTLGNKRLLEAAGQQREALGENASRMFDDFTRGTVTTRVQAAERMGQLAAQVAATGVGGSTIDIIEDTMKFTEAQVMEGLDRNKRFALADITKQKSDLMVNAVNSMDENFIFANLNLQESITPYRAKPSLFGAVMEGLNTYMNMKQQYGLNAEQMRENLIQSGIRTPRASGQMGV